MRAKSAVLGMAAAAAFSSAAIAADCVKTSLTKYTAAGFSCTISDKTFSNFSYVNGDGKFPATVATVVPQQTPSNPGLIFANNWTIATAGKSSDFGIVFHVAAPKTNEIEDATLTLSGSAKGTGFIIDSDDSGSRRKNSQFDSQHHSVAQRQRPCNVRAGAVDYSGRGRRAARI